MHKNSNIDINKVLEIDYSGSFNSYLINTSILEIIYNGLRRIYHRFSKLKAEKPNEVYNYLFVKSLHRADYNIMWDAIIKSCNNSMINLEYDINAKFINSSLPRLKINIFVKIYKSIFLIFKYRKYIFMLKKQPTITHYIAYYLRFLSYVVELENIKTLNFKILVVYSDMQRLDNLLVQYFKNTKVTVTLQHGLYIDYSKKPNINIVNHKNVVSDYFLAWGQETKELIQRYHPNCEIQICGKPVEIKELKNREKSGFFTIVFDQVIFREYNKKLLKIGHDVAYRTNLKMNLKFHPYDNPDDYEYDKSIAIQNDIFHSEFIIGHTTSMLFEAMAMNLKVFKLISDVPSNKINEKIAFKNAEDLINKLNLNINFVEESKYYIQYSGKDSRSKYSEFFNLLNMNS